MAGAQTKLGKLPRDSGKALDSGKRSATSGIAFFAFMVYVIVYLLSMPNRIPAIGVIRPSIAIAALIICFLFLEWSRLPKDDSGVSRRLLYFVAFIFLSLPFVEWPGSVLRGNLQDLIKVVLFFSFSVKLIDTISRLKAFVFVYLACQLIRVLEPLYLHYTTGYWGDATHVGAGEFMNRLSGAPVDRMINPNGLAFIIISIFPLLYYLLFHSTEKKYKLLFLGLAPFLLHALILTGSRSGMVGFAVAVAAIIARSRQRKLAMVLLPLVLITAFPFMPSEFQDRYLSIFGMSETHSRTFQGRIDGWGDDFETFIQRPVVGHGVGTSLEASFNRTGSALVSHNMYTEVLIETGIVGFILFTSFLASVVLVLISIARQIAVSDYDKQSKDNSFVLRLSEGVLAWAAVCLVFSMAQYGLSEYHFYVIGGLAVASSRIMRQAKTTAGNAAESVGSTSANAVAEPEGRPPIGRGVKRTCAE